MKYIVCRLFCLIYDIMQYHIIGYKSNSVKDTEE